MIRPATPNCHSIGNCNLQSLRALVAPLFIRGNSISYHITSQFFEARIQLIDFILKKTKDTGFFHRRLLGLAEKTGLPPLGVRLRIGRSLENILEFWKGNDVKDD